MKRRALIIAGVLLVAGIVFAASGRYRDSRPYVPAPGMGVNARTSLLTEDEQEAFYDAKRLHEKKAVPLRAEMRVLRMEIDDMIRDGKPEKDIRSRMDKLSEIRSKLDDERLEHRIRIREIVGEDKYMQMGRRGSYSGRNGGPGTRMERMHRDQRRYDGYCYDGGRGRPRNRR